MHDPVKRMLSFVRQQHEEAMWQHALDAWSRRIAALVPCLEEVVAAFNEGLRPGGLAAALLVNAHRQRFPLGIAFSPGTAHAEIAASAHFRCERDGIVYGYRYPFHSIHVSVRPEVFADLGESSRVSAERIGNSAVDFLEWASIGEGRSTTCSQCRLVHGERPRLRLVA
jgi:hypothetical protein